MENASKALIMAGSVLIALMIIGALILTFSNLTAYQETNTRSTRSTQMAEFNSQYETYNRKDVRGSDLYSLLNKAIDYNRRESTSGTRTESTWADSGEDIGYLPLTITFTINKSDKSELAAPDGKNRLFTSDKYTVEGNSNTFEKNIKGKIDTLENTYGQSSLTNLTTSLTKIFIDDDATSQEKEEAVNNFNSSSRKKTVSNFKEIDGKSQIRQDVYMYYEYIQFKRAHFDCEKVEYNNETGRITKMEFKFNGKFN